MNATQRPHPKATPSATQPATQDAERALHANPPDTGTGLSGVSSLAQMAAGIGLLSGLTACGGGGGGTEATPAAVATTPTTPDPVVSTPTTTPVETTTPAATTDPTAGATTPATTTPSTSTPSTTETVSNKSPYQFPAPTNDEQAARFLQQAQFSSTKAEIAALKASTYAQWLKNQLALPLGQTGVDWVAARGYSVVDTNSYYSQAYPADFMLWNQLMSSTDTLRKRCALALSEVFVVSTGAIDINWRSQAMAHYWDTLVSGAFGNFRQLLEKVTLHPVMGIYLNTKGNQKANAKTGRLPDENYAREVMQLFTIGLYALNADGTPKTNAQGDKIESYTPTDVSELAKVFTGYDLDKTETDYTPVPGQTWSVESSEYVFKPMSVDTGKHSMEAATFLGTTVPANTWPQVALGTALDTLFNHPNTGPFIARQLIQRLVTSNPSPAYVGRVAAAFANNGAGVRGDLSAVWTAVLLDDEARNPAFGTDKTFGKLREPMLRLVQWSRTFGAVSAAGSWKIFDLSDASNQLGQSPLRSPSVFNFFRPGYVPPGTALALRGASAPEFQLANETTVGGYLNYMQDVIRNGINCPDPTVAYASYKNYSRDVKAAYTEELDLVTDETALVDHLILVLSAGRMGTTNRQRMIDALKATKVTADSKATTKLDRVAAAVLMVMASSDYLIQK